MYTSRPYVGTSYLYFGSSSATSVLIQLLAFWKVSTLYFFEKSSESDSSFPSSSNRSWNLPMSNQWINITLPIKYLQMVIFSCSWSSSLSSSSCSWSSSSCLSECFLSIYSGLYYVEKKLLTFLLSFLILVSLLSFLTSFNQETTAYHQIIFITRICF